MPRSMVMSIPTGAPKKSKFFSMASMLPDGERGRGNEREREEIERLRDR